MTTIPSPSDDAYDPDEIVTDPHLIIQIDPRFPPTPLTRKQRDAMYLACGVVPPDWPTGKNPST
jgi:hypothetical protein